MSLFRKDPDSVLDYTWDWSAWLAADADTIDSYTVTVPSGLTLDTDSNTTTAVTAWLSGGTVDTTYVVGCRITTAGLRTVERSITIQVQQR